MVWNKIIEYRRWGIVAFHLGLVGFANYMAFILRFDGQIPSEQHALFVQTIPWLLCIRGLAFIPFHLYQGIWQYASIWGLRNIILAVGLSSFAFLGLVNVGFGLTGYGLYKQGMLFRRNLPIKSKDEGHVIGKTHQS